MNEQLDPEEVESIMSRIKGEAVKIVESHGGIVNQFVGDEVLALFGIPTAHEDDPRRAVKAALELHEAARRISPEVEAKIGRPLRMHTGINNGLIVTNVRDARDGTYGITGDTVNTGARLKTLAEDDQVLLSPETQRRVAPYFELEAHTPVELKGKGDAMTLYRGVGESLVETRFDAAEQRGFTSFTGREAELATLNACLEKALAGEGQFVTVVGEAGVGKSRLLYEFRHGLDRERVNVLQGRCQAHGGSTPYLPLIDALRRGLQLSVSDPPETLAEKAAANAKAIDPALEPYIPAYLHLLSITSKEYALPENLHGDELRRTLQEAYAAINTQSAAEKPLVFFLEDWHWADEASDAALRYLIGLIARCPLMLVVNYRPELTASWRGADHHTPVTLAPLDAANGERIVRSVLEVDGLPEGFSELIHERTGGNPFFIEEMCSNLVEEGAVRVTDGKATLAESPEALTLPDTVQAVIRSRLDRLDNDHREIMRVASVIGRDFSLRLLQQVHSGGTDLSRGLEMLKSQDLIQQVRVLPEVEYRFKHVLTQVVVYETMLVQKRKALHRQVGAAIEQAHGGRLEEHVEALAYHHDHGEVWDRAVEFQIKAGMKARQKFALEIARLYFDRAREILKQEDPDVSWQVRFESVLRQKPIPG